MLPADVYARYQRARGRETLFICATDEHGTPAELAALEEGLPIDEYCAKWWAIQKELGERFGLSWDYFGRSSSPQNHELTQHFAKALWEQGFLEDTHDAPGLFERRQALPARPLCRSAPARIAAMSARAAISARTARACSIRPI